MIAAVLFFSLLLSEDDWPIEDNRPSLAKHPVGLSQDRVALQSVPAALPLKPPLNGSFINLRVLYSFPGFLCLLSSSKLYLSLSTSFLLLLLLLLLLLHLLPLCPSFAPSRLHPRLPPSPPTSSFPTSCLLILLPVLHLCSSSHFSLFFSMRRMSQVELRVRVCVRLRLCASIRVSQ